MLTIDFQTTLTVTDVGDESKSPDAVHDSKNGDHIKVTFSEYIRLVKI